MQPGKSDGVILDFFQINDAVTRINDSVKSHRFFLTLSHWDSRLATFPARNAVFHDRASTGSSGDAGR